MAWLRWFAIMTLAFTTPFAQQLIAQGIAAVAEVADDDDSGCDGCADEEKQDCCPTGCEGCSCCGYPRLMVFASVTLPNSLAVADAVLSVVDALRSSEHGSPPFRPPTV
jgi:hypothetical protein